MITEVQTFPSVNNNSLLFHRKKEYEKIFTLVEHHPEFGRLAFEIMIVPIVETDHKLAQKFKRLQSKGTSGRARRQTR